MNLILFLLIQHLYKNKSNSLHVDRNYHYYNKKGIKVTAIVDENTLPIDIKITKASINDAKFAMNL